MKHNITTWQKRTVYAFTLLVAIIGIQFFLSGCNDDDEKDPVANFTYDATSDLEYGIPLTVQFVDQSEHSNSKTVYTWDFGDGATSSEKSPLHTYTTGGSYSVKLSVSRPGGRMQEQTQELKLTSPLVGTWKLDSTALSTLDTSAAKGIRTAIEYGNPNGWDGLKWTAAKEDGSNGYVKFWTENIFAGNYIKRKSFFAVTYTFEEDGTYTRDIGTGLDAVSYFEGGDRFILATDDWKSLGGTSLNAWKSGTFEWSFNASTTYPGRTNLIVDGLGGYIGIYFTGTATPLPVEQYRYTVALVNDNQLIVSGASNLDFGYPSIFVLKFKRVSN